MNEEVKEYANKLIAAQILSLNIQKYGGITEGKKESIGRATSLGESPKGHAALKVLGITVEEFENYVNDGYFLPSNQTKQEEGIPSELLPENHEELYRETFNLILAQKAKRKGSTNIQNLIGSYYGHPNLKETEKYIQGVMKNLEEEF
jgi:hypothetical protein